MANVTYKLAESTKEDFMKKIEFETKLKTWLNTSYLPPSEQELAKQFQVYKNTNNNDRFIVFAEKDNETIGYINVENFYIFDKDNIDYSRANINDIYVLPSHRNIMTALELLHRAIDILNEKGINQAIMNVQTHNNFRFLHYAICDEVLSSENYTRSNGDKSCSKTLGISDLKALRNRPLKDIMREKQFHQKNFENNGIELE